MGEGGQPGKLTRCVTEESLKKSPEKRHRKAGQKSLGSGNLGVDEDQQQARLGKHERLNMHRITGKSGGDSLIEMSPTESFNGE